MPGKVMPDHVVKRLLQEGLTAPQVVERLEREHGIHVTVKAINAWRRRNGMQVREVYRLPWDVPEHLSRHFDARMLRALVRRQAGDELPKLTEEKLDRWLDRLGDRVVQFVPDDKAEPFRLVEARAGIDPWPFYDDRV